MGETGLAGFLVLGADVIPGIDGDDGSFVVFVDQNGETVAEDKFGVGDVGDGDGVACLAVSTVGFCLGGGVVVASDWAKVGSAMKKRARKMAAVARVVRDERFTVFSLKR